MELELVEPEIINVKCGVCIKHTPEETEYCPEDAIATIRIETDTDPALLPVCETHSDKLEQGAVFIIKEQDGERNFQIQFKVGNPE